MRRLGRAIQWLVVLVPVTFLAVGYFMPFEDREGRCTICGKGVFEKSSPWLSEPIRVTRDSPLYRYYRRSELPDHEHQLEFMGGVTHTNLLSIPARYKFERSDPLLLVPDEHIVQILRRLDQREAQIEFLRALNCDDEGIREVVRAEVYAHYPGGLGSFMAWWEEYMTALEGVVPCAALPGPPWERRVQAVAEGGPEFPSSGAGGGEAAVGKEDELETSIEEPSD